MAETINKKHVYVEIKVGQKVYNYTLAATGSPYYEYDADTTITGTAAWTEYAAVLTAVATAAATPGTLVTFPAPVSTNHLTYNMMACNTDESGVSIKRYTRVIGSQVMSVELIEQPWRSQPTF